MSDRSICHENAGNGNIGDNKLYLECYSGISGDMTVAALLDLGADETVLRQALDSLSVSGYEVIVSRVKKAGLDVCDFHVKLDAAHENHDHDMEYLHGHDHTHTHANILEEHTHGNHAHENHTHENRPHEEHIHEGHSHEHRGLPEILQIIRSGNLTDGAKQIAENIFAVIAQAEARAHGVPVEQVHFHEVGAVDSIVDIVSVAVCLDNLGIKEVIVPELSEGRGTIRCQHGVIPVPVPAVVYITSQYGISLRMTNTEGELVTPTGAAIVAAIRTTDKLPEHFTVERIGMGAGKRNYPGTPGILRAMLISEKRDAKKEAVSENWRNSENSEIPETSEPSIYRLESNIDDCSGEILGYVMERLFEAGARDVNYIPVFMKKNRPAYQLNVICDEARISQLEQIIFEETTTIGIRRLKVERTILRREVREISTPLGKAQVKICRNGDLERAYPEYEIAAAIAREKKVPLQQVYGIINQAWETEKKSGHDNF